MRTAHPRRQKQIPFAKNPIPTFGALLVLLFLAASPLSAKGLGYALSGGGARGYAHIGILKVLEENGIYPDYITGTSIGAIIGGLYAQGYTADEIGQLAATLDWDRLLEDKYVRRDLYIGHKRWTPYGNLNLEMGEDWVPHLPSSVLVGNEINLELFHFFHPSSLQRDFFALPIPFACVATDLVTGEPVVFTQGTLMQAIRASMSIPSLVEPFEFGGRTFIDGGISQNLPLAQVRELGADVVIGLKVNSTLRSEEKLVDIIDVLDQSINIGITRNLNEDLGECDLLLEPALESFSASDLRTVEDIVAAGETYARERLDRIIAFRDSLLALGYTFQPRTKLEAPEKVKIVAIDCVGNKYISCAKIKEYMRLEPGTHSISGIIGACRDAWNSKTLHTIYPILLPEKDGYRLRVCVKERQRRNLALNLTYTTEEGLNAAAILSLNNLALKNSNLLAALTLGGKTEFCIDYVKNFGELWGSYFRIFPYLSENRLYLYDMDNYKIGSVKTLEFGSTAGLGVFANKLAVAEAFTYACRTRLYRDVSTTAPIDSLYLIGGFGLKAYHESLDDYEFPRSGIRAFTKLNFARWSAVSDKIFNKFSSELDAWSPLAEFCSLHLGLEYGSYFGTNEDNAFDPFYFSGSHGYRGYERYAVSSPQYKIYNLSLLLCPRKNLFLETGIQGLNLDTSNNWGLDQEVEWSLFGELGYRTLLGPVRFSVAARQQGEASYYLNIGYDSDIFHFSRK